MINRIREAHGKSTADAILPADEGEGSDNEATELAASEGGPSENKTGRDRWIFLAPRIRALVRLQRKVRRAPAAAIRVPRPSLVLRRGVTQAACGGGWQQFGSVHEIYVSDRGESMYDIKRLPKRIRDPESRFSIVWDLLQLVMLLYVTVMVPLRSGFVDRLGDSLIEVPVGSVGWWADLVVDIYFFTDMSVQNRANNAHRAGCIALSACRPLPASFCTSFLLPIVASVAKSCRGCPSI